MGRGDERREGSADRENIHLCAGEGVLSHLARKEPPKESGKYEGGWTTFQIYGDDGLLYNFDMLNMHEQVVAYIRKGEETLCCDISATDEKFLHHLYKRFYDKYAVDVDDE